MDKSEFVNKVFRRQWCIENLVAPNFEQTNSGDTHIEILIADSAHLNILGKFIETRLAPYQLKPSYKISTPEEIKNVISLCQQRSEPQSPADLGARTHKHDATIPKLATRRFRWKPSVVEIITIGIATVIGLYAITRNPGVYTNNVGEKFELQRTTISKKNWSPSDSDARLWQLNQRIIGLGGVPPMGEERINEYRLKEKALEYVSSAKIVKTDLNGKKEVYSVNYICMSPAYAKNPTPEVLKLRFGEEVYLQNSLVLEDEYQKRLREQLCGSEK